LQQWPLKELGGLWYFETPTAVRDFYQSIDLSLLPANNGHRTSYESFFDQKSDSLYFRLDDSKIVESEEVKPGIALDFCEQNQGFSGHIW